MGLKTLDVMYWNIWTWSCSFFYAPWLAWQTCLKKTLIKLVLLTDIEGIRGGMCQAIHGYAKAKNKYMKNYYKNIISSYLMCLDASNLYGWLMSQKLPLDGFKWVKKLSKFNDTFTKKNNEKSNKEYFLEGYAEYPKNLFNLHNDFTFLPEKKIKKCDKLVCGIEDKEKCVAHIIALKQALNDWLILKRVHGIIQFNQEAWLQPHIDINTKLRKKAKNECEKEFFKLMNNSVFGKTVQNVRKHRDFKLVTTDRRKNQLVLEPNHNTVK